MLKFMFRDEFVCFSRPRVATLRLKNHANHVPSSPRASRYQFLAPYVCFHIFSFKKLTEWPPIGKIAAHSACGMFHGIST